MHQTKMQCHSVSNTQQFDRLQKCSIFFIQLTKNDDRRKKEIDDKNNNKMQRQDRWIIQSKKQKFTKKNNSNKFERNRNIVNDNNNAYYYERQGTMENNMRNVADVMEQQWYHFNGNHKQNDNSAQISLFFCETNSKPDVKRIFQCITINTNRADGTNIKIQCRECQFMLGSPCVDRVNSCFTPELHNSGDTRLCLNVSFFFCHLGLGVVTLYNLTAVPAQQSYHTRSCHPTIVSCWRNNIEINPQPYADRESLTLGISSQKSLAHVESQGPRSRTVAAASPSSSSSRLLCTVPIRVVVQFIWSASSHPYRYSVVNFRHCKDNARQNNLSPNTACDIDCLLQQSNKQQQRPQNFATDASEECSLLTHFSDDVMDDACLSSYRSLWEDDHGKAQRNALSNRNFRNFYLLFPNDSQNCLQRSALLFFRSLSTTFILFLCTVSPLYCTPISTGNATTERLRKATPQRIVCRKHHFQRPSLSPNRNWIRSILFPLCFILLFASPFVHAGAHERRLLSDLLRNYQILERPVANETDPLMVAFGITLQQIIDVDEKNQLIVTNIWLKLEWNDTNLRWNPDDYGGITSLRISPDKVWRPDILMYNSADEKFDGTYHSNVVVTSQGGCTYIPPGIFKTTCKIDITWFPFDDQYCSLKFGSWTYQANALDLRLNTPSGEGDISTYIASGEWVLLSVPGKRNEELYDCCPDAYIDITFTIGLRRRTLYYGFNLIVPSVIISSMTLLSFTLPPDSGEKLTLGVTILLSLIVFLMQLAEIMPATSDSVSIVGTYFACIMIMVAFSVVCTVIVLNLHHRSTEHQEEMPRWIRTIICRWLPKLLRVKVPTELFQRRASVIGDQPTPIPKGEGWYGPNNYYGSHIPHTFGAEAHYVPGSPTHQELLSLTVKMREYEVLCHQHTTGGPSVTPSAAVTPLDNLHHNPHLFSVPHHYPNNNVTQTLYNSKKLVNGCFPDTFNPESLPEGDSGLGSFGTQTQPQHSNGINFNRIVSGPAPNGFGPIGSTSGLGNGLKQSTNMFEKAAAPMGCCCVTSEGDNASSHDCYSAIMQEMRFITNRMRREDDLSDIIGEWKFAATVIDRLCLIVFSSFAVISTAVFLASAPHLIV